VVGTHKATNLENVVFSHKLYVMKTEVQNLCTKFSIYLELFNEVKKI